MRTSEYPKKSDNENMQNYKKVNNRLWHTKLQERHTIIYKNLRKGNVHRAYSKVGTKF